MVMSRSARVVAGSMFIVGLAGCGADPSDAGGGTSNSVNGVVKEWSVSVDAESAMAGEVTFTVANEGSIGHEFLVVKTDIEVGKIPLDGDHFPEPADGLEVVDEIGEFPQGTTESLTLMLEPGKYQLVCNLPGHYAAGM
ncbi:MAG: hypothetical protein EBY96_04315, partial [Actinobacteria bacterium]|nr:hypothetical protein [Actinomycetota bacterium]